jgi:hypothetical protein
LDASAHAAEWRFRSTIQRFVNDGLTIYHFVQPS